MSGEEVSARVLSLIEDQVDPSLGFEILDVTCDPIDDLERHATSTCDITVTGDSMMQGEVTVVDTEGDEPKFRYQPTGFVMISGDSLSIDVRQMLEAEMTGDEGWAITGVECENVPAVRKDAFAYCEISLSDGDVGQAKVVFTDEFGHFDIELVG